MSTSENEDQQRQLGPIGLAVAAAVEAAPLAERDGALVALADAYASDLDLGGDLAKLGPGFLRVLDALQMTPKSRAVAQRGGASGEQPQQQRDELRELRDRRARKRDAPAVDSPAP